MFEQKDFMRTTFTTREQDVPVKGMAAFFGDAKPVWRVRGMTSIEYALVDEAAEKNKNLIAIIDAVSSSTAEDKAEAMREMLGLSGDVPEELVKRHEMLVLCSVKPKITLEVAVKLGDAYPIEMRILTGTIMRLTGLGKQPGKLPGSGETPTSEPQPATDTSGENLSTNSDQISSQKDS